MNLGTFIVNPSLSPKTQTNDFKNRFFHLSGSVKCTIFEVYSKLVLEKKDIFVNESCTSLWNYSCRFLTKFPMCISKNQVLVCCYQDGFFKVLGVFLVLQLFQQELECLGLITASLILIKLSAVLA